MPPAIFEPAIPASDRPQTYALDRAATGIGYTKYCYGGHIVYREVVEHVTRKGQVRYTR